MVSHVQRLGSKLVFLLFEEDVEGGEGAVAFGDVLLHLDFFAIGEFFVGVDLLFEDAEVVADHDDFVEEDFERHFLGLQGGVVGVEDAFAAVPAETQFFDDDVGQLEAQFGDEGFHGLIDDLLEGHGEGTEGGLGFGGFQAAGFGGDGAAVAVIELDVGDGFRNGFNGAGAVLRVAHSHAHAKQFNFHERSLVRMRAGRNKDLRWGRCWGETIEFPADNAGKDARLPPTYMTAKRCDRFEFERTFWGRNILRVAGVDEAGRGPLAGPGVAAAAILPWRWAETGLPAELAGLNDSKQLTASQRERFFDFITSCAEIEFGVARVEATVIDEINILQATHRAMNESLARLSPAPPHALVDGRPVKGLRVPQTAIVKGDARSYSIAAASVLAKVTRDRLMEGFDRQFPGYGFAKHKGYGTAEHLAAIDKQGACAIHRKSFAPLKPAERELF